MKLRHDASRAAFVIILAVLTGLGLVNRSAIGMTQSNDATALASAPLGTWQNVTPSNVNLNPPGCGNYGSAAMVADPARPSNLYTSFACQGIWKSTNYGRTWTGPINTGAGGSALSEPGNISIARGPSGRPPILYSAGIRGTGMGFWRSLDGGVSWTNYYVAPGGSRQDFYTPAVDPGDGSHLVMPGHENNLLVQSFDGGMTWASVSMAPGMTQSGGTGIVQFINTGNAITTRSTWLWLAQGNGGFIGTWRTADGGATWTHVDNNEHPHGNSQIYQPDTSGVVYMGGIYSALGWGVLRSADYGQTWAHVGGTSGEATVFGTPHRVYSMYSWACAACNIDPAFESAAQPGISGWTSTATPPAMSMGAAQAAVVYDGRHYAITTANWGAGLWRYVEPGAGPPPTPTPTATPTATPIATPTPPMTPTPTATPSPAPTHPLNNTPCSLRINGVLELGTCDGAVAT